METQEIAAGIRSLDQECAGIYQQMQQYQQMALQKQQEADSYLSMARSLSSYGYDDPDAARALSERREALISSAMECRSAAQDYYERAKNQLPLLLPFRERYQRLAQEAETALSTLAQAGQKLLPLLQNRYGGQQLKDSLVKIQDRMQYTRKLIQVARQRIDTITQLTGQDSVPRKILKK